MVPKELTARERARLEEEIKSAPAVGGIPVADLVKLVGDYLHILLNYDLD